MQEAEKGLSIIFWKISLGCYLNNLHESEPTTETDGIRTCYFLDVRGWNKALSG